MQQALCSNAVNRDRCIAVDGIRTFPPGHFPSDISPPNIDQLYSITEA